jgi:hypothetical protein
MERERKKRRDERKKKKTGGILVQNFSETYQRGK